MHENDEEILYSSYGPCDIADMVKTYFRELPEVLLTNKLSEIFIAIFQCKFLLFHFFVGELCIKNIIKKVRILSFTYSIVLINLRCIQLIVHFVYDL